jgi:THO complex subunit 2
VPGRGVSTDRFGGHRTQDTRREPPTAREPLDPRDSRTSRDLREPRDARDGRDPREIRDTRTVRDLRDPRENRDVRDPRDFRTPENRPDRGPRDFSSDRRPDILPRDTARHPERDWPRNDAPPRWNDHGAPDRTDSRVPRERLPPPSRTHETRPVPSRDAPMATPSQPGPPTAGPKADAAEVAAHKLERGRLATDDRPEILNPGRAAMISESRGPLSRPSREEPRERLPSRNHSPRGTDRRPPDISHNERGREERHSRQHPSDTHNSTRDAHSQPSQSSTRERYSGRDGDWGSSDRAREPPHPSGSLRQTGPDPREHPRPVHQDPNYGRLNAIPSVTDAIPSGPRGRGKTAERARVPSPEPLPAERAPPTGPSSSRTTRRGRGQFDSGPSLSSPVTTTAPPPASGVHPDRLAQIGGSGPSSAVPQTQPATPIQASTATPQSDRHNQSGSQGAPPSGPSRSSQGANSNMDRQHGTGHGSRGTTSANYSTPHVADSRSNHSTPTGPAGTHDRTRNRGERLFKGIQDTLTSGGPRRSGPSGRGFMPHSDAQVLTGGSPVTTPIQERADPLRRDSGADRLPSNAEPQVTAREGRGTNTEEYQGAGGRDYDRNGRREHRSERTDRSERPSRRNSRERSPPRDRESKSHRDHRDRRSDNPGPPPSGTRDNREGERDRPPPRRSGRDVSGINTEPLGPPPSRDPNREPLGNIRDMRHRTDGRADGGGGGGTGGRGAEDWGSRSGGGSARDGGLRPGDERRDGREDRGRKRRSEEGPSNERDKRPRR